VTVRVVGAEKGNFSTDAGSRVPVRVAECSRSRISTVSSHSRRTAVKNKRQMMTPQQKGV
jgi:hypothetical protein